MQSSVISVFICSLVFSSCGEWRLSNAAAPPISKTITVSPSGGDYSTISQAIREGVPVNNVQWVKIIIRPGEYREQVIIPAEKPYIVLEGVNSLTTTITFSSSLDINNATIVIFADNIVARRLCFKNTYNHITPDVNGKPIAQAVAVRIVGDKVSFYDSKFLSVQDTIYDAAGRHFFHNCFIEGSDDFIFGNGQSVYERCNINVSGNGYITAQGRSNPEETTGFVFKFCQVLGSGETYLGRAWRSNARVIFYETALSNIIAPEGWMAWNARGHEDGVTFAEVGCSGPGSDTSKRVKWEKKLSPIEVQPFISQSFHNADHWIENQP